MNMFSRNKMINVFEDTIKWINASEDLSDSVKESIKSTKVYFEDYDHHRNYCADYETNNYISFSKTFE